MKKLIKWFVELTKDSSTETKKWGNLVFHANVLLSWTGCLIAIIAVSGICLTSCTNDRMSKDIELGKRLADLKLGESINLVDRSEYTYLFRRFDNENGSVDLGGNEYPCRLNEKNGYCFYNLVNTDTSFYYQVKIYTTEAAPAGGVIKCMEIKKLSGQYKYCITVGNFEITLLEIHGSRLKVFVVNNQKKLFAYAEMLPTQGFDPIWQQIRFSNRSSQSMDVLMGNKLILYEYVDTDSGIQLEENCRIPYIAKLFEN